MPLPLLMSAPLPWVLLITPRRFNVFASVSIIAVTASPIVTGLLAQVLRLRRGVFAEPAKVRLPAPNAELLPIWSCPRGEWCHWQIYSCPKGERARAVLGQHARFLRCCR